MILGKMKVTATLTRVQCGECGGVYAISERYREMKREKGGFWTCPYCRNWWGYPHEESLLEQERDKVKRANDLLARERAEHEQTTMSLRAHKAAKTRLKNRISKGICPCCNRYFKNLQLHIQCKHPSYINEG